MPQVFEQSLFLFLRQAMLRRQSALTPAQRLALFSILSGGPPGPPDAAKLFENVGRPLMAVHTMALARY